jgi:hypothetical protein
MEVWNSLLNTLAVDLSNPFCHWAIFICLILSGVGWARSEQGSGMRKLTAVAFAGSVALGALQACQYIFVA